MHLVALGLLLSTMVSPGIAGVPCNGPAANLTNVTAAKSTNGDQLNSYTLTATVKNIGTQRQRSNVLQSVDIYLDGAKNGQKGIPPLRPGQTYSFTYNVQRAEGAAPGSTSVRLQLVNDKNETAISCSAASRTVRIAI